MPFTLVESPGDQPLLADVLPDCLAAMGVPSPDATGRLDLPKFAAPSSSSWTASGRISSGPARGMRARSRVPERRHRAKLPQPRSGITSLTTASRAGDHGMVAYSVWDREQRMYLNQLSGWGTNMPPDTWQLRDTVFETVRGASPVVVSVEDYRDSGLTLASLRGADYLGAETMRERSEVAAQAARELAHPLIYLYHAELDQTGHSQGWESDAWTARLEELDASIDRLLELVPDDIGILLLADHGMVDVARERQRDIDDALPSDVVAVAGSRGCGTSTCPTTPPTSTARCSRAGCERPRATSPSRSPATRRSRAAGTATMSTQRCSTALATSCSRPSAMSRTTCAPCPRACAK